MISGGGRRRALRVGAAAVAMVVVAEAAVWLLRPRERPIEPVSVSERDYFTAAQIERGRTYTNGQLWLLLAAAGAQGAVLVAVALGRPAALRRGLERLEARPILGAAVAGAVVIGAAALWGASEAAVGAAAAYGVYRAIDSGHGSNGQPPPTPPGKGSVGITIPL
jgi:hypothetical protein